jgi:hypothetical protein
MSNFFLSRETYLNVFVRKEGYYQSENVFQLTIIRAAPATSEKNTIEKVCFPSIAK